ncbi:MAG TPA: bifunctional MaoC family dehydratase N-terminal/OB-fold nucleic acid binding domain-containing protein [Myxococcota bacterium]|jgi:uncharacterized OB-fold protein/acyl dehydratase
MSAKEELEKQLAAYVGIVQGPVEIAQDAVNEAMIRHWCEAMGDRNPAYLDAEAAKRTVHGGIVAPPVMLQAWILGGLEMADTSAGPRNKQQELHKLLSEHGYTGVVATNTEQEYLRYLRPGDRVAAVTTIASISDEKATGLGTGYFIETRTDFRDQENAPLGSISFRVLKFKPAQQAQPVAAAGGAPPKPRRLRAPRAHDNGWWWEAVDRGELLIQKCSECGALRHPPRPMCPACQSTVWSGIPSKGRGTVYSYVVMRHPPIPGYDYPLPIAVIDLEEGTRIVSNVVGCKPEDVYIGMKVKLSIENVDEDLKLPLFRPAA